MAAAFWSGVAIDARRGSPSLALRRRPKPRGREPADKRFHKTRHQNMAFRDRAPEPDFRDGDQIDEGNTAISRHFEHGPLRYALETDWPVGVAGFEPVHQNQSR